MSLEVNGYLSLIDCSNSHNQVLFRRTETIDGTVSNLDVLFEGVKFLNCPFDLKNPTIEKKPLNDLSDKFSYNQEEYKDCNLYIIKNSNSYIIAEQGKYQYNNLVTESLACKKKQDPLFDDMDLLIKRIDEEGYHNVMEAFKEEWSLI
jgi:hypothetical protein